MTSIFFNGVETTNYVVYFQPFVCVFWKNTGMVGFYVVGDDEGRVVDGGRLNAVFWSNGK